MDLSSFRLKTARAQGALPSGFGVSPFSARAGTPFSNVRLRVEDAGDSAAIKVSLKSKRVAAANESPAPTEPIAAGPDSGITSLLKEVRSRTARIQQLQVARNEIATGTEQFEQYTSEIAAEQQALQSSLKNPSVDKILEIIRQVQGGAQAGASPLQLAKALESNRGLVGSDFIARVGNGEFSNISQFGEYLSKIQSAVAGGDVDQPGFFEQIESAVAGALRTLDGRPLPTGTEQGQSVASQSLTAPLPEIEQLSFSQAEGLSVSLRGYIGANAIQAAMAHIDYDARDAIVLLEAPEEDRESKLEKEKKKQEETDARLSSGIRPPEAPSA